MSAAAWARARVDAPRPAGEKSHSYACGIRRSPAQPHATWPPIRVPNYTLGLYAKAVKHVAPLELVPACFHPCLGPRAMRSTKALTLASRGLIACQFSSVIRALSAASCLSRYPGFWWLSTRCSSEGATGRARFRLVEKSGSMVASGGTKPPSSSTPRSSRRFWTALRRWAAGSNNSSKSCSGSGGGGAGKEAISGSGRVNAAGPDSLKRGPRIILGT
jgi:hypothetical protein